jgi:hypothetical protein
MDIEKVMKWLDENAINSIDEDERLDVLRRIVIYYEDKDIDQMMQEISNYDHHEMETLTLLGCLMKGFYFHKDGRKIRWIGIPYDDSAPKLQYN